MTDTQRRRLTEGESERLIAQHTPLVKAIAHRLLRKLPPNVELDDLVQDGYIGLLGAILQTTKERAGSQFQHYISQRIRGAMLDGLRENDPGTRSVRHAMRNVERTINELEQELGRSPHEDEIAQRMAMPLADYQRLLQEADGYTLFSIEDFDGGTPTEEFLDWCASTQSDPLGALQRRALQRQLLIAISDLTEREGEVMALVYVGDLTRRAAGERLGLSESRISQIHTQAVAKLRAAVMGREARPSLLAPRRNMRDDAVAPTAA